MFRSYVGKIWFYLKQLLQALVLFVLISTVLDWWRKPEPSSQARMQPIFVAELGQTDLTQFSQDKTVLVYFWGSWCSVCRITSPVIDRLHKEGVPVLGIAVRSGNDADVRRYLGEHGWSFRSAADANGMLAQQWKLAVTPTIVLVRNGEIKGYTSGISTYWGLRARLLLAQAK